MTDAAKQPGSDPDDDRETARLYGPALLRAIKPVALSGGKIIPPGKGFEAAGDLARRLYDEGLVEVLVDYGRPEPTSDSAATVGVEEGLRQLERNKRQAEEAQERAQRLRQVEAQTIERYLGNLEGFAEAAIGKHTEGSVSLSDLLNNLFDWNDDLLEGRTPAELQGTALETDRERAGALLSYVMLVQSLRSDAERGIVHAKSAAGRSADTRAAELLTLKLQLQGEFERAQDHQEEVVQRMRSALQLYDEALPDLLEALRIALGLLASMDPEDLLEHAHQRQRRQEAARKLYKRAGVDLFRRIIAGEGTETLEEIWQWAGTGYYRTVEVEGTRFQFEKRGDGLKISAIGEDGLPYLIRNQSFVKSTLYEWRTEALALSSSR